MEGTPDREKFESFWKEHCERFLREYPPSEAYPPPCKNPYFPWHLLERNVHRSREDWVNTRNDIFGLVKTPELALVSEWFKYPKSLMDKAPYRTNGLVMWDRCILVPRYSDVVIAAGQACGVYSNTDWIGILNCLNDVTTSKRPSGDFVFDVMNMEHSWDIMETAHILTHKMQDVGYYSSTSNVLAAFVLKICLALKYNLVIDMDPHKAKDDTRDSLDLIGCRMNMSPRLRQPVLDIPATGPKSLMVDRDTMVISGSVQFEPQPNPNNVAAGKWLEVNRWSCLPTIVCFAGWQTSDFISHSQLVQFKRNTNLYWEVQVQSLEPPSMFFGLLPKARPDNVRYWHIQDYWKSRKYNADRGVYPTLPCRSCMKVNPRIEGCPQRPPGEPCKSHEWAKYTEGMEAIFQTCHKATVYQEGRKVGHTRVKRERKAAKVNYAALKKLRDKLAKLEEKIVKKRFDGYITESRELRLEAVKIRDQITSLEEGKETECESTA